MTRRSIVVLAVVLQALPALAGPVTVGGFYVEIAKVKQLGPVDAMSAEAGLRAAGYRLPTLGHAEALTEGDVASISVALGLKVTTSRPAEPVTDVQVSRFVSSFSTQLGATGTNPYSVSSQVGDPGNSGNSKSKGKGKKKGHNKSPSGPI